MSDHLSYRHMYTWVEYDLCTCYERPPVLREHFRWAEEVVSPDRWKVTVLVLGRSSDYHCLFQQIFRPPLDVFDVIIHLEHRHLPRRYHAIDLRSKVGIPNHCAHDSDEGRHEMPVTNYDPVQCYLRELRVCCYFFSSTFWRN